MQRHHRLGGEHVEQRMFPFAPIGSLGRSLIGPIGSNGYLVSPCK